MKSANEAGFTLAEMLVSLLIISLSLASIWQGGRIVSHLNKGVAAQKVEAARLADFRGRMEAGLLPLQPITGADIRGDGRTMVFGCTGADDTYGCSLTAPSGHFVYVSNGSEQAVWPPEDQAGTGGPPRLEAIVLRSPQGKSLEIVKFPVEHGADCQFDMISRTCRDEDPSPEPHS